MITLLCGADPAETLEATNEIRVTLRAGSDLVVTDAACSLRVNVKGTTATFVPGQKCTIRGQYQGQPTTEVYTLQTGTFALDADRTKSTVELAGSVDITIGQATATCGYHRTAPICTLGSSAVCFYDVTRLVSPAGRRGRSTNRGRLAPDPG